MKPVTQLKHEEEFERSWIAPGNTRIELPPVDINLVLARVYRTNEPLRFTRTMLWDMEVKKAFRPDLYIPSVVSAGSSCYWRIVYLTDKPEQKLAAAGEFVEI